MKDRLIELMQEWGNKNTDSFPFESVADYLLANGVIVPPCKAGDTVYSIENCIKRPEKLFVTALHQRERYTSFSALSKNWREYCFNEDEIGKTIFLTEEEAEQALKGGVQE